MRRFDWRAALDRLRRLWRRSLRVRTVAITVALSAIAVTIIGAYISTSVRTNLFESRKDQVVAEAGRAATSAQEIFTTAGEASEAQDLESVIVDARRRDQRDRSRRRRSSRSCGRPDQEGQAPFIDRASDAWDPAMASDSLRAAVLEQRRRHRVVAVALDRRSVGDRQRSRRSSRARC